MEENQQNEIGNAEVKKDEIKREEIQSAVNEIVGKKFRKIIGTVVVVIVVIALTGLAIFGINASKNKKGGKNGMPPMAGGWGGFGAGTGGSVTAVQTVIAEPQTIHDFVKTNGNVETQRSVDVTAATSGIIVQVNVGLGSKVQAGDIIAYIDPSTAGQSYKWSPVTAPISGSILQAPVKVGQQVSQNTAIAKIGDTENLQVTAKIPERYVAALKKGLKAEVTFQAYPDTVFKATVARVSPVLDSTSRTKEVILNFDKKDSRINAGMFAKVKLYTYDYPNSISIPQDAIVTVKNDSYIYVVKDDNTVEKRLVTLGHNVSGNYQITDGINPFEKVVVAGMLTLSDGAKVKDINDKFDDGAESPEKSSMSKPEKFGDGKMPEIPGNKKNGNQPGKSAKK